MPMRLALWVVGEPGCGKTTLVRRLLGAGRIIIAKPKWTIAGDIVAAGHYTGDAFDGADRVPYNGVAESLAFWARAYQGARLTIFDGDRFSNAGAVERVRAEGARCACILLTGSEAEIALRRAARSMTAQDASWVRGRRTKAAHFYVAFPESDRLTLMTAAPEALEQFARQFIDALRTRG